MNPLVRKKPTAVCVSTETQTAVGRRSDGHPSPTPSRAPNFHHARGHYLGPKLELTSNPAWGEHCRKEALAHAGLVDRHLSDGRDWLLGGTGPTFSDITLCTAIAFSKYPVNATPLDKRFEYLDRFWGRWQGRESFRRAYADGMSGIADLDQRLEAA